MNLLSIAFGDVILLKRFGSIPSLMGFIRSGKNLVSLHFKHVASTSSHDDLILFCVIAWLLWKNRNAQKHGEFAEVGPAVIWRAKEWLSAYVSGQMTTQCPSLSSGQSATDVKW